MASGYDGRTRTGGAKPRECRRRQSADADRPAVPVAGGAISLRRVTDAFEAHHGIEAVERAGDGRDPDGDGFVNELTRADVTAVTIYQATLPVPGRVIPDDPDAEAAIRVGERQFEALRCTRCHVPALPLDRRGWMYTEPTGESTDPWRLTAVVRDATFPSVTDGTREHTLRRRPSRAIPR